MSSVSNGGGTSLSALFSSLQARQAADEAAAAAAAKAAIQKTQDEKFTRVEANIAQEESSIEGRLQAIGDYIAQGAANGTWTGMNKPDGLNIDRKQLVIDVGVVGPVYTISRSPMGASYYDKKPDDFYLDPLKKSAAFASFVKRCADPSFNMDVDIIIDGKMVDTGRRQTPYDSSRHEPHAYLVVKLDTPPPAPPKAAAQPRKAKPRKPRDTSASKVRTTPPLDV